MTPPSHSVAMAAEISGAELVSVEGAGHAVILERPDAVAEALIRLLDRIGDENSPVDPELAGRVRSAVEQLVGRSARVVPGRVELAFGDEHDLAELAEALENAVATMRPRAGD